MSSVTTGGRCFSDYAIGLGADTRGTSDPERASRSTSGAGGECFDAWELDVCTDRVRDREHWHEHSRAKIKSATNVLHTPERDLIGRADSFSHWSKEMSVSGWTRSVCRFCADVLRWAHEEEKRREVAVLQLVVASLTVRVDPETKMPLAGEWDSIAQELEKLLGYDVSADNGIQLRHGRLSFDPERQVFLFTWTERKKFLDF